MGTGTFTKQFFCLNILQKNPLSCMSNKNSLAKRIYVYTK